MTNLTADTNFSNQNNVQQASICFCQKYDVIQLPTVDLQLSDLTATFRA
ncbi:hypothetical protein [Merismopedia glauca]|nr:hypothetical protein [Merismopedia glauca]